MLHFRNAASSGSGRYAGCFQLAMLAERAAQGITVEKLDEQRLRDMEPQARSATVRRFMCQARP